MPRIFATLARCRVSSSLLVALLVAGLAPMAEGAAAPDGESRAETAVTPPSDSTESRPSPAAGTRFSLQGGVVHQFDGSLRDGGRFDVTRTYVRPGLSLVPVPDLALSLSVGWNQDRYGFKGSRGLGGLDPWGNVNSLRAGAFLRWAVEDRWTVFLLPTLRTTVEEGGRLEDGVQGGGFTGFSYRFSDTFEIGPGFGAITQIEDRPSFFPVILVDWKITDELTLRTGRGLGATQGPGLSLVWAFAEGWDFTVGGRFDRLRFRLDDSGVAPGGVGEESSVPLYAGLGYAFGRRVRVTILGGMSPYGALRLEDAAGTSIATDRHDPTGFVGLLLEVSL